MPGVLSKILLPEWSFPYNCYEVGHTWTPFCTEAALDMATIVLLNSLKLYAPLFFGSQLVLQKKFKAEDFWESFKSTFRSSALLTVNSFMALTFFCGIRHASGKFYYTLCAYLPMFLASILSIYIEKPSRRSALAVYCANIASETLYHMAKHRDLVRPIKYGEMMIFTASMTVLLYIIKKRGYGHDPVSQVLKFVVGRGEAKSRAKSSDERNGHSLLNGNNKLNGHNHDLSSDDKLGPIGRYFVKWMPEIRHESCPHGHGCIPYVSEGFVRPFLLGALVQTGMSLVSRPNRFIRQPSIFWETLFSQRSRNFGLFLGTFTCAFRLVNCALRWHSDGHRDWHGLVGGLAAGPAMIFSPNASIAQYLMWKTIESCYCEGIKAGVVPSEKKIAPWVYALSAAQLFYVAILEPRSMRPSYMKFLDRMSEHRLHWINRFVLDVFGTEASDGYEGYFPDLHPDYTSRQFKEQVLIWLVDYRFM